MIETTNLKLKIPEGTDYANIPELTNTNNTILEKHLTNVGTYVDTYSNAKTYNLGELVIYNNILYKNTTKINVAEAWNASKWTQTNIANIITTNREIIDVLYDNPDIYGTPSIITIENGNWLQNYKKIKVYYFNTSNNKQGSIEIYIDINFTPFNFQLLDLSYTDYFGEANIYTTIIKEMRLANFGATTPRIRFSKLLETVTTETYTIATASINKETTVHSGTDNIIEIVRIEGIRNA